MINPKYCPCCSYPLPQLLRSKSWVCRSCDRTFVIRGWSDPPPPSPPDASEKPERTDLIAQAYAGELTVAAALKLAICLVQQAKDTVQVGGFTNYLVPVDGTRQLPPLPKLRITA